MAIAHAGQTIPIIPSPTEIPFFLPPEAESVFSGRAQRLKQLAEGHAMGDYLRFMAGIAQAQAEALSSLPELPMPALAAELPPLSAAWMQPSTAWHAIFSTLVDQAISSAPADYAAQLETQRRTMSPQDLERWARAFLEGQEVPCGLAMEPLLGASLQVYWTALASRLEQRAIRAHAPGQSTHDCPVCGSLPVGGIIRAGAAQQGLRYLSCSLCASEWNMERIRCVSCGDNAKVFYYGVEGDKGAVQAETCDACHSYTKLMHMEKDPAIDIMADDLATMSLDVLVGEAGYQRFGFNPFLITGSD